MTAPMLAVRLQEDLAPIERNLIFHALMHVHGVESVTDLSAISPDTLRLIMREPIPAQPARKRGSRRARQAELPLEVCA